MLSRENAYDLLINFNVIPTVVKGYYLCGVGMEGGIENTEKDMEENLCISTPARSLHPQAPPRQPRGRDCVYLYTGAAVGQSKEWPVCFIVRAGVKFTQVITDCQTLFFPSVY